MSEPQAPAELTAQAERVAAEIAQTCTFPTKYATLVDLLALAYLRGGQDALQWSLDGPLSTPPVT